MPPLERLLSRAAEDLVDTLLSRPRSAQRAFAKNSSSLRRADVCEELIRRSWSQRHSSPRRGLFLAELAVAVATSIGAKSRAHRDLLAAAATNLGNAKKVAGDFAGAEAALGWSADLAAGTRDPAIRARRLECLASLRIRQAREVEAIAALKEAAATRAVSADPAALAATLLQLAMALHESGSHDDALSVVNRANSLVRAEEHPQIALMARHYGALILADSGQFREALSAMDRTEWLYSEVGDPLMAIRKRWLRARILAGLNEPAADSLAERDYLSAKKDFQALNMRYEVAEVTLELAQHHAARGRTSLVASAIGECLPIFDALGIARESLAGRLVMRAAQEHHVAAALLAAARRQVAVRYA